MECMGFDFAANFSKPHPIQPHSCSLASYSMELRKGDGRLEGSEYEGSLNGTMESREEQFADVEERTAVFRSWEWLEVVFFVLFGIGARGMYRLVRGYVEETVFLRIAFGWSFFLMLVGLGSVFYYHQHWLTQEHESPTIRLLLLSNFILGALVSIILPYILVVYAIDDLGAVFRSREEVETVSMSGLGRTDTESGGRLPKFREHWRPLMLSVCLSARDGVRSSLPPSLRNAHMRMEWKRLSTARQQCAAATPAVTAVLLMTGSALLFYMYRWICWEDKRVCNLPSGFLGFLSVYGIWYWNALWGYSLMSIVVASRFTTSLCEFVSWQAEGTGGSLQSVRHDLTRFMRLMDIVGETISLMRKKCGMLLNLTILAHFLDLTLSTLAHIYTDAVDKNSAGAPTGAAGDHSVSSLPIWGVFVAVLWDATSILLILRALSMPGDVSATFSKGLVRRLVAESESAWDEALRSHGIMWWARRHERRRKRRKMRLEREAKERNRQRLQSDATRTSDDAGHTPAVGSPLGLPESPQIAPPPLDLQPVGLNTDGVIPDALVLTTAVKYTTFLFRTRLTLDFFGVALTSEATLGFANVLVVALIVWCSLVQGAPSITALLNLASGSAAAGSFFSLFILLIIAAVFVSLILSSTTHVHIFPRALRPTKKRRIH